MIQNKIYTISAEDVHKIIEEAKIPTDLHLVELQGEEIQSWGDYISKIETAYEFPTLSDNMDGYNDWITDLDWLGKDGYILIIHNYNDFLKQNPPLKKTIMDIFVESILPWWQEEVERCVAGGKAKPFNVYLVD